MTSPCEDCRHYFEEDVEMFLYTQECDEDMPEPPFMSPYGCWAWEKRKEYDD